MRNNSPGKITVGSKGSYTVEIGILVPLILMILIGVVYEAAFQYQRVLMSHAVESAACTGALLWEHQHKNPVNNDIYWRLFSNRSAKGESGYQSQELLMNALEAKVGKEISRLIIKPRSAVVEAKYIPGYLQPGKIDITAKLTYAKPFGTWWDKLLGIKNSEMLFNSECSVTEPAENIRNMDLAFEIGSVFLKEAGVLDRIDDFGDGIKEKLQDKINGIKNSIFRRDP